MKPIRQAGLVVFMAVSLAACAGLPDGLIAAPDVRLTNVQVAGLGFDRQSFVLSFGVHNPNSVALPVRNVSYGIRLDGQRFASGETASNFRIPANGASEFSISVDLDLLSTTPQLLSIIRDGVRDDIAYELDGRFGVDLPLVPELRFSNAGSVRLDGTLSSFLR